MPHSTIQQRVGAGPIGIWEVTSSTGSVWYYMFQKGHRVFWSHQSTPSILAGAGYWVPRNGTVNIQWDSGNEEQMTASGTTATGKYSSKTTTARRIKAGNGVVASFTKSKGMALNSP